jgi:hypothetical protein
MHPAPPPVVTQLTFVHVNISGAGTNVMTEDAATGTPLTGVRMDHADGRTTVIIQAAAGNLRNNGPVPGGQHVIINAQRNINDAVLKNRIGTRYLFKK